MKQGRSAREATQLGHLKALKLGLHTECCRCQHPYPTTFMTLLCWFSSSDLGLSSNVLWVDMRKAISLQISYTIQRSSSLVIVRYKCFSKGRAYTEAGKPWGAISQEIWKIWGFASFFWVTRCRALAWTTLIVIFGYRAACLWIFLIFAFELAPLPWLCL